MQHMSRKGVPRSSSGASRPSDANEGPWQQDSSVAARGVVVSTRSLEPTLPEDVCMEQVLMKLQLLEYERDFCRRKKPCRSPLTPIYFAYALPTSRGNEQFFYLTSMAAWLLRLCGASVPSPKEFDDPNTTIANLLSGLRSLGFPPPSYPPIKLAVGYGPEVCALLDALADAALAARGWAPTPLVHMQLSAEDSSVLDDPEEDTSADVAADDQGLQQDDSEELGAYHLSRQASSALQPGTAAADAGGSAATAAAEKEMLVSSVEPMLWKLEAERVAPRLRITLPADARDWRQHLDTCHASAAALEELWPQAEGALARLAREVGASLEKLEGRETSLNAALRGLLADYKAAREQLAAAQQEYNRGSERVSDAHNELARLGVALEEAKAALDARGSSLADASPLVAIKAAITSLQAELGAMEVRIGVVNHALMDLSLRGKQAALRDAAAAATAGGRGASGKGAAAAAAWGKRVKSAGRL